MREGCEEQHSIEYHIAQGWRASAGRRFHHLFVAQQLLETQMSRGVRSQVRLLCRALCTDSYWPTRAVSLEILEVVGTLQDVGAAVERLSDRSAAVRMTAAETLGELRSKTAYTALKNSLRDRNEYVRRNVATSLGLYGRGEVIPLMRSLISADDSAIARVGYYGCLLILGEKDAPGVLHLYTTSAILNVSDSAKAILSEFSKGS